MAPRKPGYDRSKEAVPTLFLCQAAAYSPGSNKRHQPRIWTMSSIQDSTRHPTHSPAIISTSLVRSRSFHPNKSIRSEPSCTRHSPLAIVSGGQFKCSPDASLITSNRIPGFTAVDHAIACNHFGTESEVNPENCIITEMTVDTRKVLSPIEGVNVAKIMPTLSPKLCIANVLNANSKKIRGEVVKPATRFVNSANKIFATKVNGVSTSVVTMINVAVEYAALDRYSWKNTSRSAGKIATELNRPRNGIDPTSCWKYPIRSCPPEGPLLSLWKNSRKSAADSGARLLPPHIP